MARDTIRLNETAAQRNRRRNREIEADISAGRIVDRRSGSERGGDRASGGRERLSLSERQKRNRELGGEERETIQLNQPQAQPPEDESFLQRQIRERPVTAGAVTGLAVGAAGLAVGAGAAITTGARVLAGLVGRRSAGAGVVKAFRAIPGTGGKLPTFVRSPGVTPGLTQSSFQAGARKLSTINTKAGFQKVLSSKPVKLLVKGVTTKGGRRALGSLSGYGGIMTWLASDNIMSQASFHVSSATRSVESGDITREKGLEIIEDQQEFVDTAARFINTATIINPLMWPFRNIIMTNQAGAQKAIDDNVWNIKNTQTTPERQAESQEAFNINLEANREAAAAQFEEQTATIEAGRRESQEAFDEKDAEREARKEADTLAFNEAQEGRALGDRQDSAYFEVLRQMKSPFPEGTPVEDIDPNIVALARESNLFLDQF